jgi:hypothetical protein
MSEQRSFAHTSPAVEEQQLAATLPRENVFEHGQFISTIYKHCYLLKERHR